MSYISEKVAYLNGLAEGLEIKDEKEGILLLGILEALSAIAEALEEQDESIDDLNDSVDDIYNEIDEIDECLYGEDEDDEDEDDDDFYEIVCPACGETVYFDFDMIEDGKELTCPNCNEPIEIKLCNGGCDCDCGCEEDEE